MREIIITILLAGLFLLAFVVTLIIGLTKKNKNLKLTSLILLTLFCLFAAWTGVKFVSKSYHTVAEYFHPRTGDEIYDALFDKRQADCLKVLHSQDQVVPKIDYAIWLHIETCPEELERILNRYEFTDGKIIVGQLDGKTLYEEGVEWFNPMVLGDTIMVYEYSSEDSKNVQTIWTNLKGTRAFVRDIYD